VKDCIQNFGGETFWKMSTWKTEKELGDGFKLKIKEASCGVGRWMELTQDRVQWRISVLAVSNLRFLLLHCFLLLFSTKVSLLINIPYHIVNCCV
jgi:hypothetical protein